MSRSPFEISAIPAQREMLIQPAGLAPATKPGSIPHGKPGDTFLPCHVCGEKAGKHSYYGGQVCPSCRAFFRRSVQSGYNTTYVCVKNQDCEMSLKTRKNCQFCRYKMCVEAGMKTAWVLTDEERKVKFEGRVKKKNKSGNNNIDDELEGRPSLGHPKYISEVEISEVNYYLEISEYHEISKVHDMETPLIREIIRLVAFQQSLSKSGQAQLRSVMAERAHLLAIRVLEWIPLSHNDIEKLLHQNIPILVEMQICTFFNPNLLWRDQITPLIGREEVTKLERKLRSLNVTGLDDVRLDYEQFATACFLNSEKYMKDLIKYVSSAPQDPQEFVLISLVLLFCPDLLDLEDRRRVEDVQAKFAVLLQKYIKQKNPASSHFATVQFASLLNLISKGKELYWSLVADRSGLAM